MGCLGHEHPGGLGSSVAAARRVLTRRQLNRALLGRVPLDPFRTLDRSTMRDLAEEGEWLAALFA